MKLTYTNPNILAYTSRRTVNSNYLNTQTMPSVTSANNREHIYDKSTKIAALSVIAGVGAALIFGNKLNNIFVNCSNMLKKYKQPKKFVKLYEAGTVSGPNFSTFRGKTAIADAWNKYISDIQKRINSPKDYSQIISENIDKLEKFETVAKRRSIARFEKAA